MGSVLSTGRRALLGKLAGVVVVMAASGACAGLLGIGGALIFNPFLLQLGVHPAVCILGFVTCCTSWQLRDDVCHSLPVNTAA